MIKVDNYVAWIMGMNIGYVMMTIWTCEISKLKYGYGISMNTTI